MARLRQEISPARQSNPDFNQEPNINRDILKKEEKSRVTFETYKQYFSFAPSGPYLSTLLLFVYHLFINLASLLVGLYLAFVIRNPEPTPYFSLTLVSIMLFAVTASFGGKYLSNRVFLGINQRIHDRMVQGVVGTKVKFFESHTSGQILNRFSKDVAILDKLVFTYLEMMDYLVKCTLTVLIVVISCPWLLVMAGVSLYSLIRLRQINLHCTRDTFRLKATLMAPINSLLQDTISGLVTIRAMGASEYFLTKLFDLCD